MPRKKSPRAANRFGTEPGAGATRSLGEELREAHEDQTSPIPLDVRVEAGKALDKLEHFTSETKRAARMRRGGGPPDPAVQVLSPFVYSARDDDVPLGYNGEMYEIPAGKVTEVPPEVAQFIGLGGNPGFPGIRVIFQDSGDATIKRDAREDYMRWVSKFVNDTLRARLERTLPSRLQGLPAPTPSPDEAHAMLLARKYGRALHV